MAYNKRHHPSDSCRLLLMALACRAAACFSKTRRFAEENDDWQKLRPFEPRQAVAMLNKVQEIERFSNFSTALQSDALFLVLQCLFRAVLFVHRSPACDPTGCLTWTILRRSSTPSPGPRLLPSPTDR